MKNYLLKPIVLLCFFQTHFVNSAFSQIFELKFTDQKYFLNNPLFIIDTSYKMSIADVVAKYSDNLFKYSNKKSYQSNFNVYWVNFTLINRSGFDKEWILDFKNWAYVDVYIKDGTKFVLKKTGHLLPFFDRDYKVANKAYVSIPIKRDEAKFCFVRLQATQNNDLVPQTLDFAISPKNIVDKENNATEKVVYAYAFVVLVMFFYNLFLYLSTFLKSYGLYLVVILLTFYHATYNSGYLVEMLGKIHRFPIYLSWFEKYSSVIIGIFVTLFISEYLQIKTRYPKWFIIRKWIIWAFVTSCVVITVDSATGDTMSIIVGFVVVVMILFIIIKSMHDGYPVTVYFLVGYILFLGSGVLIMLTELKILPKSDSIRTIPLIVASSTELVLFSLALANLINSLRKEKEEIKLNFQNELLKTKNEIQEQTFKDISEELHDNITQTLAVLKLKHNILIMTVPVDSTCSTQLSECKLLVDKVLLDLRNLSRALNPDHITRIGIKNAIEQELNTLYKTGRYEIKFCSEGESFDLPAQSELFLFRIVQELLHNIIKHANASTISVFIKFTLTELFLIVTDDGDGFDIPEQVIKKMNNGMGLRNLQNRINLIGGKIKFESANRKGTNVYITLPRSS